MTLKDRLPKRIRDYWNSKASDEPAARLPSPPPDELCLDAVGAALTFLFDPTSGRRRRKVLTDKLISGARIWDAPST